MDSEWKIGNREAAHAASRQAKTWAIVGFVVGTVISVVLFVIIIIVNVASASAASASSSDA